MVAYASGLFEQFFGTIGSFHVSAIIGHDIKGVPAVLLLFSINETKIISQVEEF